MEPKLHLFSRPPAPLCYQMNKDRASIFDDSHIDYVMDTTVASKHRRWKKSRLTRNANPIIQTNHEQKSTPLARHLGKLIIKQPICRFLWYYIRSSPPCDRISSCLSMQAYWMINSKTIPNCSHKK